MWISGIILDISDRYPDIPEGISSSSPTNPSMLKKGVVARKRSHPGVLPPGVVSGLFWGQAASGHLVAILGTCLPVLGVTPLSLL